MIYIKIKIIFIILQEGKLITELNKQRLNNIKELSAIISRINNIVFFLNRNNYTSYNYNCSNQSKENC